MKNRIKLIAYWLYVWTAVSLIGLFWATGVFEFAIGLLIAGVFYQAGTGVLKLNSRDRKIAICLLVLLALLNLDTLLSALNSPEINTQVLLLGAISTLIFVISSIATFFLLKPNVVILFNGKENA